ncbi:hypothetical protein M408DRAFT_204715 [Serendipita vermifera MAFF 305830]|uniref:Prolyl 4-hydroxylase alpha subunit domain-containing protein n=1 Tax=Serendipita vermifera MAFF 305830 TaxID=933852 RepID=A0A0C3B0S9_SERVB|nr:hypothetical protein M408DRAFT_204715 [Serendipita vermifera MAFF 305830]
MPPFLSRLASGQRAKAVKTTGRKKNNSNGNTETPRHMKIVATSYTSKPVKVFPSFLKTTPYDAQPILTYPVDFAKTPLPEYEGLYAVVLDNVLSPSECKQLIAYAEESAGLGGETKTNQNEQDIKEDGASGKTVEVENNGWRPAMVNAGRGREVLMTDYRNSDRIIWDDQDMMNRLWARCLQGEGIKEQLGRIEGRLLIQGPSAVNRGEKWHFSRLNERMRFLKYGPGQFFKEHCDGQFTTPGRIDEQSFITLHLYLNDSLQALTPVDSGNDPATSASFPPPLGNPESPTPPEDMLRGGATPFHSMDMKRKLDVDPKAGRVLLFQHKGLLHSGDYVTNGVKYTMRTDLMYELEEFED